MFVEHTKEFIFVQFYRIQQTFAKAKVLLKGNEIYITNSLKTIRIPTVIRLLLSYEFEKLIHGPYGSFYNLQVQGVVNSIEYENPY